MTMVMDAQSITATKLKAQLLGVLDDVSESGSEFIVTKHGKPVAQLVPVAPQSNLIGMIEFLVDDDELIKPLDLKWDALEG